MISAYWLLSRGLRRVVFTRFSTGMPDSQAEVADRPETLRNP